MEWAQRAGKLAFQQIDDLHEDDLVTFTNLCLFWHSQGSWRICFLNKGIHDSGFPNSPNADIGTACNLLRITEFGSEALRNHNSWKSEIRRRRFWACYLMHCHTSERLSSFEPWADIENLALPWPEEDFDNGMTNSTEATLALVEGNGGTYSEVIKVLTLW